MNLVQALERFNRKERYWLIQAALGPAARQLDAAFRDGLQTATVSDRHIPATRESAYTGQLSW